LPRESGEAGERLPEPAAIARPALLLQLKNKLMGMEDET
jgi:hypothetical protein